MPVRISIEELKKKPIFTKWDVVLYAMLIVAISITMLVVLSFRTTGNSVRVYYNNQIFGTYSLDKNTEISIDGHMVVIIRNGVVWVEDADCPDKVCMTKHMSTTYDPIYCVPNNISIEIISESDPNLIVV